MSLITRLLQRRGILNLCGPSSFVFLRSNTIQTVDIDRVCKLRFHFRIAKPQGFAILSLIEPTGSINSKNPELNDSILRYVDDNGRGFLIRDVRHYTKSNYTIPESITDFLDPETSSQHHNITQTIFTQTIIRYRKFRIHNVVEHILMEQDKDNDFLWVSESESKQYFTYIKTLAKNVSFYDEHLERHGCSDLNR